jgi:predicted phosphodiesterase
MRIQYASDLHLEFGGKITFAGGADVLLLAGDIGKPDSSEYRELIHDVSTKYPRVYVTTGNHEYYGKLPMDAVDAICREVCNSAPRGNVVFLQNESHELADGLRIFGGTFWTHIPPEASHRVMMCINDYRRIPDFEPDTSTAKFNATISRLDAEIKASAPGTKWIVMSHHMPSRSLISPEYRKPENLILNYAFASDIDMAADRRIIAWVYGHTHTPNINGKFYCNAYGYPGEKPSATVEAFIDTDLLVAYASRECTLS